MLNDRSGICIVDQAAFGSKTIDGGLDLVGCVDLFENGMEHFAATTCFELFDFAMCIGVFEQAGVEEVGTVGLHDLHLAVVERVLHRFGSGVEEKRVGFLFLHAVGLAFEMRGGAPFKQQFALCGKRRCRSRFSVVGVVAFGHSAEVTNGQTRFQLLVFLRGAPQCVGKYLAEGVTLLVGRDDDNVLARTGEGDIADVETFDTAADAFLHIVRSVDAVGRLAVERYRQ